MPDATEQPELDPELLREVHRVAKIGTWAACSQEKLIWSDETLDIFGVDRSAFSGSIDDFYRLVHPEDIERVHLVADFNDSKNTYFKSEYRVVRPDGGHRHIRQTAIVLRDEAGSPRGFSGVVQDVTEQVNTEAQLRQAQKMEMIGNLSGGVAHDFNNILAIILGAANLLQEGRSYDAELVESIVQSVSRGKALTNRLLAFARKQPLKITQFDVAKLIKNMVPMLDRMIGQDIVLKLDLPDDLWLVEADPAPFEDSLLNLVVNSRDAISGGGCISITCSNKTIEDTSKIASEYVEVLVIDNGEGMSDEVKSMAADPFYTTKPVGMGSGLGLSMVEGYVRQIGGEIQIDSREANGTRISLLMPRSRKNASSGVLPPSKIKNGAGEKVLVIDDNEDLAKLFVKQLKSLNYMAAHSTDRATALQKAQEAGGFDVVLADILLADGDRGPSVADELLLRHPKMKVVFMTGFSPKEDAASETGLGDAFVLKKPFSLDRLSQVMHQIANTVNSDTSRQSLG